MNKLRNIRKWVAAALILLAQTALAVTQTGHETVIRNGVPWFDNNGNIVNAHGACIVRDGGRYYLFGEYKSDESNAFPGFSCYSSTDLVNWKFERVVLKVQKEGMLGPNRVGERVKVMRCPKTGEYVMFFHDDNLQYKDPCIGVATSKTINGEYTVQGPLMYQGHPVKRWDMGTFQDTDGQGYVLIHHGDIYRLSDDYRSAAEKMPYIKGMGESPAMFKKQGVYFLLTSNLTSWEKNDNFYLTAPSIRGPWTKRGLFCPEGSLTYASQTTFVFPLINGNDTVPMFMGDRWSYPHQASAATYVWMPAEVSGTSLSIPRYWPAWDIRTQKPTDPTAGATTVKTVSIKATPRGAWKATAKGQVSTAKGSKLTLRFKGRRAAFTGEVNRHSGYARVNIYNNKGKKIYTSLLDFYALNTENGLRFITPVLPSGNYTLEVVNEEDSPQWTDKTKTIYGSDGTQVTVGRFMVFK